MSIFTLKRDTLERPSVFGEGDTLFRYNFASRYIKNKRVLDIGTGYGDGAHYLLGIGAKEVVGIDNSKMAIIEARKKFPQKGLVFKVMDALNLQFPKGYFDTIIAYEIIEHLPAKKHRIFLKNIKSVLKKNGYALLSTPNKLIYSPNREKPNNPYHIKEYLAGELETFLKKYFFKVVVMGIKIINKQHIAAYNNTGKGFRNKILAVIGRFKLVRELAGFIPKSKRIKITGEDKFPHLTINDFKIYRDKIKLDTCVTLMAIMKR